MRHDVIRSQILKSAAAMAPWLLLNHGVAEARPVVVVPLVVPIASLPPLLPLDRSMMVRATTPYAH